MAKTIVTNVADVMGEVRMRLMQLHAVVQVAQDPRGESLATMNSEMQSALLSLVEDRIIEIRELVGALVNVSTNEGAQSQRTGA